MSKIMKKPVVSESALEFGKYVRERRMELGISLDKLWELTSINRSTLIDIEHGRDNLTLETIKKIFCAFDYVSNLKR